MINATWPSSLARFLNSSKVKVNVYDFSSLSSGCFLGTYFLIFWFSSTLSRCFREGDVEKNAELDGTIDQARARLASMLMLPTLFLNFCGVCRVDESHASHILEHRDDGPVYRHMHCGKRKPGASLLRLVVDRYECKPVSKCVHKTAGPRFSCTMVEKNLICGQLKTVWFMNYFKAVLFCSS